MPPQTDPSLETFRKSPHRQAHRSRHSETCSHRKAHRSRHSEKCPHRQAHRSRHSANCPHGQTNRVRHSEKCSHRSTCLLACLPTYPPAYLPTCLPTSLPTYLPTCLSTVGRHTLREISFCLTVSFDFPEPVQRCLQCNEVLNPKTTVPTV